MASKRQSLSDSMAEVIDVQNTTVLNENTLQAMGMLNNRMFSLSNPDDTTVREVSISLIKSFHNHPFKVKDDDAMEELMETIDANGVIMPVLLRPIGANEYECISGHRRIHASKRLGKEKVPAIVKRMNDDEAVIAMVESNKYREKILPSERAFSLKMKLEAMAHQGKAISDTGKDTRELIGEEEGLSRTQVYRFIKLTELDPRLLELVDNESLPLNLGFEIAGFTPAVQSVIYEYIEQGNRIKLADMNAIKKFKDRKEMTLDELSELLIKPKHPTKRKVMIPTKKIDSYFPPHYTQKQIEEIVYGLLEQWKKENE